MTGKTSVAQRKAIYKYQQEKLKRIPFDVHKEDYPAIKNAADLAGESVNGYIRKAVQLRMMLGV